MQRKFDALNEDEAKAKTGRAQIERQAPDQQRNKFKAIKSAIKWQAIQVIDYKSYM